MCVCACVCQIDYRLDSVAFRLDRLYTTVFATHRIVQVPISFCCDPVCVSVCTCIHGHVLVGMVQRMISVSPVKKTSEAKDEGFVFSKPCISAQEDAHNHTKPHLNPTIGKRGKSPWTPAGPSPNHARTRARTTSLFPSVPSKAFRAAHFARNLPSSAPQDSRPITSSTTPAAARWKNARGVRNERKVVRYLSLMRMGRPNRP